MTRAQGTFAILVLLAMLVVAIHVAYVRKRPATTYEYKAMVRTAIDVAEFNSLGAEGWDCFAALPIEREGKFDHFDIVCKRSSP